MENGAGDYKNILSTKEECNVDLEKFLVGHKVKVSYDRHVISTNMECSGSDYYTLTGTVEDVCNNGNFILFSYFSTESVEVLEKGILTNKHVTKERKVKKKKIINTRYIIDLNILD